MFEVFSASWAIKGADQEKESYIGFGSLTPLLLQADYDWLHITEMN